MRKKNRHKIIIGIEVMILSITVSLLGPNAASANPPSNGVSYNKNGQVTVENALDNLYSKANYGNATAGDILKGKKALVGGKEVVGTFTCPTLASLTPGDATPEDITFGKIAWVNGNKVVGTYGFLADIVQVGDYISYTPSKTRYYVPIEYTGKYSIHNVEINPSELNLWRVIQKNKDGTVDIVSEYLSSVAVGFQDYSNSDDKYPVYKSFILALNEIAASYKTEGITVGSRHMGYDGTAKEYLSDLDTINGNPDKGYETDVRLVLAAIGTLSAKPFGENYSDGYWLASRYIISSGRKVNQFNDVTSTGLFSPEYHTGNVNYVRPIVVLKSDLNITGGDGTESSPYTLGT